MTRVQCIIRRASLDDSEAIAQLLPDLEYEASTGDVVKRLERLLPREDQFIALACLNGAVVGLCHAQLVPLVASDGYVEVQALVVKAEFHRQGVGQQLVQAGNRWAASHGFRRVRLRSGIHREDAHRFYEAIGFERKRASYAFEISQAL